MIFGFLNYTFLTVIGIYYSSYMTGVSILNITGYTVYCFGELIFSLSCIKVLVFYFFDWLMSYGVF